MTKVSFALKFSIGLAVIIALHQFYALKFESRLNLQELIKIDAIVFILALMGYFIMAPEIGKKREQFVARFLILTTIQMLAVLSIVAFIAYSGKPNFKLLGVHQIAVFTIMMIFQSILLGVSRKS